jgi:signal transduction histidine kinase
MTPPGARRAVASPATGFVVRLASKIFLASALVILILGAGVALNLVAVERLTAANAVVVERTAPALRTGAAARESLRALRRLEARHIVLRDPAYALLWDERAARLDAALAGLRPLLSTDAERRQHAKTTAALRRYVVGVRARRADDDARTPLDTGALARRAERALDALVETSSAALADFQGRVDRLQRRARTTALLALPAAVVAALLGAALLALRITRSLRRLHAATREVAEGRFRGPVPVGGRDEIGALGRAFNDMAARLGEVDRLKQELFAHISHELRTPLTAVQEAAHLLRDEVPGPLTARQARLVEIVAASTARVLRLVNQILELSRLRAGLRTLERRPLDLGALVGRAIEELRPQAEARALRVERHGTPRAPVTGDEERLLEMLVNLLGNAIKFTPPGGRVGVRVAERRNRVEIVVEDDGPGIPADALPHVFDRYWQAPGAREGSGLGLAIVRSVVEAHGGAVAAESADGRGSRFTVQLPRATAHGKGRAA